MIRSFKHRGLKRLFERDDRSGIRPDLVDTVQEILTVLDRAATPQAAKSSRLSSSPAERRFEGVMVRESAGVSGRSAISPEMAIRLTKAFGSTEETWLGMQLAYDLAAARKDESRIKVQRQQVPQEVHVH